MDYAEASSASGVDRLDAGESCECGMAARGGLTRLALSAGSAITKATGIETRTAGTATSTLGRATAKIATATTASTGSAGAPQVAPQGTPTREWVSLRFWRPRRSAIGPSRGGWPVRPPGRSPRARRAVRSWPLSATAASPGVAPGGRRRRARARLAVTGPVTAEDGITTRTCRVAVPRAYAAAWGERLPERDIALGAGASPTGLWSDGATVLVSDSWVGKVHGYRLSDGAWQSARAVDISGAGSPQADGPLVGRSRAVGGGRAADDGPRVRGAGAAAACRVGDVPGAGFQSGLAGTCGGGRRPAGSDPGCGAPCAHRGRARQAGGRGDRRARRYRAARPPSCRCAWWTGRATRRNCSAPARTPSSSGMGGTRTTPDSAIRPGCCCRSRTGADSPATTSPRAVRPASRSRCRAPCSPSGRARATSRSATWPRVTADACA